MGRQSLSLSHAPPVAGFTFECEFLDSTNGKLITRRSKSKKLPQKCLFFWALFQLKVYRDQERANLPKETPDIFSVIDGMLPETENSNVDKGAIDMNGGLPVECCHASTEVKRNAQCEQGLSDCANANCAHRCHQPSLPWAMAFHCWNAWLWTGSGCKEIRLQEIRSAEMQKNY